MRKLLALGHSLLSEKISEIRTRHPFGVLLNLYICSVLAYFPFKGFCTGGILDSAFFCYVRRTCCSNSLYEISH